jgi:hypothetical protein
MSRFSVPKHLSEFICECVLLCKPFPDKSGPTGNV